MKRPDQRLKRKFDTWLGTLIYHAGQGQADPDAYGQRLQSMVAPLMQADTIQDACRVALAQTPSSEDKSDLKSEILKRCTPERMTEHITSIQEILTWRPLPQEGERPRTIGDLIQGWAELTSQNPKDFQARIYPKVAALVQEWQFKSGGSGLTDEEVFEHPKEAGEFMAGLTKLLLEETPQAKLVGLIVTSMRTITETSSDDLEAGLQDILGDGCAFTAWRTGRQVGAALEANPQVKAALSPPEVAALVQYEEQRMGWGGDVDKAVRLLESNLGPQLQQQIKRGSTKTAFLNALKLAGRRSLLNNLRDAVKGHLSGRLIETAVRWWLQKGGREELNLTCRLKEGERTPVWNGFWKDLLRR